MTPNHRKLLTLCLETGIKRGLTRAYKHTETPSKQSMVTDIENAIWEEIDEFFDWQQGVQ